MALSAEEMRGEAWKNVVHAQGTYTVFARRSGNLRFLTDLRDYVGLLVIPTATAFVATVEISPTLAEYRKIALLALGAAAAIQALLAGWSLVRRWDDQRSYSSRAMRDSYEMKIAWEEIGKGDVGDLKSAYELRKAQQKIIDSHDIGQDITDREKRSGMRAGLFEVQRTCIGCGKIPNSTRPPLLTMKRCSVCGGRMNENGSKNAAGR